MATAENTYQEKGGRGVCTERWRYFANSSRGVIEEDFESHKNLIWICQWRLSFCNRLSGDPIDDQPDLGQENFTTNDNLKVLALQLIRTQLNNLLSNTCNKHGLNMHQSEHESLSPATQRQIDPAFENIILFQQSSKHQAPSPSSRSSVTTRPIPVSIYLQKSDLPVPPS